MPRLTRRSLADDASSRSRSRTPAKASKTTVATPSPSPKTGGRKGKTEEKIAESSRQGRSASRGKAAAASPASTTQAGTRQSRSRSRGVVTEEKKTPTVTKRGREKTPKGEQEEEEVKPKRARGRELSKSKSPVKPAASIQSKGKSPAESAVSTKKKGKSSAKPATPTQRSVKSPAAVSSKSKVKSPKAAVSPKSKAKSPAKAAVSTKSRAKPAKAAASRSSRSPRAATVQNISKKKEPKKSTPRSGRVTTPKGSKSPRASAAKPDSGKKKADAKKSSPHGRGGNPPPSTPKSRSRRSQELVGAQEEKEKRAEVEETANVEKEQEKAEDVTEEMHETENDVEMREDKGKDDGAVEQEEVKEGSEDSECLSDENSEEKISKGKEDLFVAEDAVLPTETDTKSVANLASKNASEEKEGALTAEKTAIPVEAKSEPTTDSVEDTSGGKDLPDSGNTAEPMEDDASEEPVKDALFSSTPDLESDKKNGKVDSVQPSSQSGVKRKFEEVSADTEKEPNAKQVRLNGTESEKEVKEESIEPLPAETEPAEADLLKDYVVINKDEIPPPDSCEVAASVPAESENANPEEESKETEMEAGSSGTESVFVVPLTQVEMIKACAYGNKKQTSEQGDGDDVSSIAVEVGSLSGSEIIGGISRHLEISDVLSATNSTDGEVAADSSMDDTVTTEKPAEPGKELEPCTPTALLSSAVSSADSNPRISTEVQEEPSSKSNPVNPTMVSSSDTGSAPDVNTESSPPSSVCEPVADTSAANSDSGALQSVSPSEPEGQHQNSSVSEPSVPVPVETAVDPAHNLEPAVHKPAPVSSLTKGPSMVTDSLGTPDPAFLSTYSSPGILNRAYVPNPAVVADSVTSDKCFSLVSYNILAECNRLKADYSYTAEEFLCQEFRHDVLMKELQYLDGDIVCLQEVNPDYFNNTLLPAMKSLGYDGLMMRRTKDVFDEGEATFFRTSVFEMESSKGVSLAEVAFKEVESGGLSAEVETALKKYLDRADVVLIARLRSKASGRVVTIGNIHVVWDFSHCPDVQCAQAACAIKEVVNMSGHEGAHIICGDFNSDWTTPAYQMVVDGYLSEPSISALQNVNNLDLENGSKSLVNHFKKALQHTSPALRSAYSTVTKSEPQITTLTSFMESAVDYQFYSADSLAPVGVLKTIDQAVIKATGGLPSKEFPSDHVSLKSVMTFCK